MAEAGVDFVEAHEIEMVGSGEEEFATGASDAVHLGKGGLDLGQVLDSFAGDEDIEGVVGKGQALGVALNERNRGRVAVTAKLGAGGVERGSGKSAGGDVGSGAGEEPDEAAAATRDFEDTQAGDGAEVFEHEAIPG